MKRYLTVAGISALVIMVTSCSPVSRVSQCEDITFETIVYAQEHQPFNEGAVIVQEDIDVHADFQIKDLVYAENIPVTYALYRNLDRASWMHELETNTCTLGMHIAIDEAVENNPLIRYREFYRSFLNRLLALEWGINTLVLIADQNLRFVFDGQPWSYDQIREAFASVGVMAMAVDFGIKDEAEKFIEMINANPNAIQDERYDLIRHLIERYGYDGAIETMRDVIYVLEAEGPRLAKEK